MKPASRNDNSKSLLSKNGDMKEPDIIVRSPSETQNFNKEKPLTQGFPKF